MQFANEWDVVGRCENGLGDIKDFVVKVRLK